MNPTIPFFVGLSGVVWIVLLALAASGCGPASMIDDGLLPVACDAGTPIAGDVTLPPGGIDRQTFVGRCGP